MKRTLLPLIALVSTTGCSHSWRPYQLNPTPTQSTHHVAALATGKKIGGEPSIVSINGQFRTALLAASGDPTAGAKAKAYLDAGVTVADLYCDRFFRTLAERKADNDAARGAFNIADGVTSAVLGLADASTNAVAGASVGFSAIEALFENIDANYLVSPEIAAVEALVFDARATLREDILTTHPPAGYYEAERSLRSYAALCSFNGVKRLVSEAVANGKPELAHTSQARSRLADASLDAPKAALAKLIGIDNLVFSDEQLVALYAFYFLGNDDAFVNSKIETLVKASIKTASNQDWPNALLGKATTAKLLLREIDSVADIRSAAIKWREKLKLEAEEAKAEAVQRGVVENSPAMINILRGVTVSPIEAPAGEPVSVRIK